ncbi:MAG: head-tail connector protein [Gammaproteobacteria bacterium]|nr:head-tail connector protein [Gammaproteobacteria bacterium]
MITLTDIKQQCRIDDCDTSEDALLYRYLSVAKVAVSRHIDRKIFASEQEKGDKDGVVIDEMLEMAMLLLIGHFYEHREATSDIQMFECPLGYDSVIDPYRNIGV